MKWSQESREKAAARIQLAIVSVGVVSNLAVATPNQQHIESAARTQSRSTVVQQERSTSDGELERLAEDVQQLSDAHEQVLDKRRRDGMRDGELRTIEKAEETTQIVGRDQAPEQRQDRSRSRNR